MVLNMSMVKYLLDFMFKFKGLRGERGISEVFGATLVIATIIPVISLTYAIYVQSSTHSSEADHMNDVQSKFLQMKSEIESMKAGESRSVNIRMDPDFPLFVPGRGETGVLSVKPGSAWGRGGSSYQVGKGEILGSLDALQGDDGIYLEINQIIYSEKFPDTSGWVLRTIKDDPDTFTPGFDQQVSDRDDGTGSVHVGCLAWKGGGPETRIKKEAAYWVHDIANNLDNVRVTVQAWLRKIVSFVGEPEVNVLMRIDIKDNKNNWDNGVLYYSSTGVGSVWWTKLQNHFDNGVRAIRAFLSAADNAANAAYSSSTLDLWWDDIVLQEGPPFDVDITIVSNPILTPENVDNITVILNFCSKDSPSLDNLYIRNYTNSTWELLKSSIVDQNEVTWENKVKADNHIGYDNTIRIRMTGHNDNSPFRLCLDYLEFQLEPKIPGENILFFYGGSGNIMFDMRSNYYPDQTFLYDDGAVILAQGDSSVMVSDPGLVVVQPAENNKIKVFINHFVVKGSMDSVTRGGWSTVSYKIVDNFYLTKPEDVPENENVVINIDSTYVNAWESYLSGLVEEFNKENYNANLNVDLLRVIPRLTLTIKGKDNTSGNNDIYYYEKVTNVQVSLS